MENKVQVDHLVCRQSRVPLTADNLLVGQRLKQPDEHQTVMEISTAERNRNISEANLKKIVLPLVMDDNEIITRAMSISSMCVSRLSAGDIIMLITSQYLIANSHAKSLILGPV